MTYLVPRASGSGLAFFAAAFLFGACSDEDSGRSATSVNSAQENEHADAAAASTHESKESCDARDQQAGEWLKGYKGCERDVDCEVTRIAAKCVPAFLCFAVLSTNIDRQAFELEAEKRQVAYEPGCGCWVAKCGSPTEFEAYCDTATKLCDLRPKSAALP